MTKYVDTKGEVMVLLEEKRKYFSAFLNKKKRLLFDANKNVTS